jgi:hypothetical protein
MAANNMSVSSDTPPNILYHYTTTIGLKGILETSTLWATDATFLNDAQELQFGRHDLCSALLAKAQELVSDIQDQHGPEYSRASIIQTAVHYLMSEYDVVRPVMTNPVYVTCFCEEGDLLSQWRGYSGGGGFALGFAPHALLDISLEQEEDPTRGDLYKSLHTELVRIQYGDAAIQPVIDQIVAEIAPEPKAHSGTEGWHYAMWKIVPALAGIKHGAFAEEREWRLIALADTSKDANFRVGPYGLIPFIALKANLQDALKEVVIGPGVHSDLRALATQRMLDHRGLTVTVRVSDAHSAAEIRRWI